MERSILVLEDEPAVLALVSATLAAGQYEDVITASSIAEAREQWARQGGRFDLVLTDFSLPDGSTRTFIYELLEERPDLKVILMSGLPEEALGLDHACSHAVRIFPKPFRPAELLIFLKEQFQGEPLAMQA